MDFFSSLTSSDLAFDELCSDSLDLIEQIYRFDASEQSSTYQGMSVQTLDTSFPVYYNHSDIAKNNADPVNSLIKYRIKPLTLSETADCFCTGIPQIPQSVLDEYVPWKSNEPHELSSRAKFPPIQQVCLSGSEPEIREPTPASHSNPDYPLTNLPDLPSKPQYLRPYTVVNPLNLNQTTSDNQTTQATEIVDDHSSIIERQRESKRERQKEYQRESMRKLRKDPAYAERERKRSREQQRKRYQNDPDFAERKRTSQRARKRARQKERYQNDPDFARRVRKRSAEYNEYKRKLGKDPAAQNGCEVYV
ncbi:hypothetical protein [Endozoicomonas sp. GU-1]|uniref:hypothetical protein n=1 Tax=Endozoicomonas sp. GU-1 TaxID=3009078 RepID=UPI0022B4BB10|nr:hypothetical protein [Endozoicomonas sp. GU-1]WBA83511.1 hypothetical protein O2T12_10485 [Endozoicomonas sp. GU-1]WBA86445.1 hypothetical protein O3276_25175 [Endozoicomonas sp. GU-1]